MKNTNLIKNVMADSPGAKAGIRPGMTIKKINGQVIKDIFDFHYQSDESKMEILLLDENGEEISLTVIKEQGEPLGVEFYNALGDEYHSCNNKCIFCFIDQMPPGMRDTLYFKDDDTRLSFLQGNYVTLTNVKDEELDRIIGYRLAPINVSIHVTDPKIRCEMLGNRFAGDVLEKLQKIKDAKLPMNGQIVLCKGINDGQVLLDTLRDLEKLYPYLKSVSVVPVGLTKYRDNLPELLPFNFRDAAGLLRLLEEKRIQYRKKFGVSFVYPSDEWYLMCRRGFPGDEIYDGYPQLENGVGMMRLLIEEFKGAYLKGPVFSLKKRRLSIATGELAYPVIRKLMDIFMKRYPGIRVNVYPIKNMFFGERVTVSGLVTGGDIISQLKGADLGERLLIPVNMLRYHERVFLDDVKVSDLEDALHTKVTIVESDGEFLFRALIH